MIERKRKSRHYSSESTETASPAYKTTNMAETSNQTPVKPINDQSLNDVRKRVVIYATITAISLEMIILRFSKSALRRQTGTHFINRSYNPSEQNRKRTYRF